MVDTHTHINGGHTHTHTLSCYPCLQHTHGAVKFLQCVCVCVCVRASFWVCWGKLVCADVYSVYIYNIQYIYPHTMYKINNVQSIYSNTIYLFVYSEYIYLYTVNISICIQ